MTTTATLSIDQINQEIDKLTKVQLRDRTKAQHDRLAVLREMRRRIEGDLINGKPKSLISDDSALKPTLTQRLNQKKAEPVTPAIDPIVAKLDEVWRNSKTPFLDWPAAVNQVRLAHEFRQVKNTVPNANRNLMHKLRRLAEDWVCAAAAAYNGSLPHRKFKGAPSVSIGTVRNQMYAILPQLAPEDRSKEKPDVVKLAEAITGLNLDPVPKIVVERVPASEPEPVEETVPAGVTVTEVDVTIRKPQITDFEVVCDQPNPAFDPDEQHNLVVETIIKKRGRPGKYPEPAPSLDPAPEVVAQPEPETALIQYLARNPDIKERVNFNRDELPYLKAIPLKEYLRTAKRLVVNHEKRMREQAKDADPEVLRHMLETWLELRDDLAYIERVCDQRNIVIQYTMAGRVISFNSSNR